MSDQPQPDPARPDRHWRTRLIHPDAHAPEGFRSLAPVVYRGSTVLFERLADAVDDWRSERYTYGLYGTPTTLELAARVAEIEGAAHSVVVPGGQAAFSVVYFAYCKAGSHALVPENAYGPHRELARKLLAGLGVEVETYDPMIAGGIADLLRPNTSLVWCEVPGSVTMEIQDVPAIAAAARARGVPVALDNTYAAGVLFDAFAHGVDVSMQALTKYIGGHSDLLLGTISVNSDAARERIADTHRLLGMAVSPDDCALALRGLKTLGVRLEHLERSTLAVATWLRGRTEVARVLHPAFPECPGHDVWKRDFTGSASIFSIVFSESWTAEQVTAFVERLRLFKIGYSWGGVTSLAMTYPILRRVRRLYEHRLVRLNIGLEEPRDLIDDLQQALNHAAPRR